MKRVVACGGRALVAFDSLHRIEVGFDDGSTLCQVAEPTALQRQILQGLGMPSLERDQPGLRLALT